jgi:hypothetical protein
MEKQEEWSEGILTQRSPRAGRRGGNFAFAAMSRASSAALDEILGDFAEAGGAVGVGAEFGDGFCG